MTQRKFIDFRPIQQDIHNSAQCLEENPGCPGCIAGGLIAGVNVMFAIATMTSPKNETIDLQDLESQFDEPSE